MYVSAFATLLFLSAFVASVYCGDGEYYWRPWTPGSPPSDAVTGRDYRGVFYIVESYVPNHGLYIGQVFANQHEVNVTISNSSTVLSFPIRLSRSLKVLCSQNPEKLTWYPTSYYNIQNELVTAVINPVIGGINEFDDVVYIGKFTDTSSARMTIIGSIVKDNKLHYPRSGSSYSQFYYEILVVNGNCK